ncbi:MAG TPA: SUMF1/EgtB/PvdO family nonheme iron enzyme [Verrucomicrobiae bacterium]|nr:SUMF1/EgtB/PvdO family nonheme iron enzyme [Verrucomicrobiae bacterium]
MKCGFLILAAAGFLLASSAGAQAPMTEAEQLELRQIIGPLQEAQKSALQSAADRIGKYVKDLGELEEKMVARGDLDAVVGVRREREAWAAGERTRKPDAPAKLPAEFNTLRHFLDRDIASIDGRAEAGMKRETARALSGLKAFEVKLTRAARIEAALAVREIAARVEKGEVPGGAPVPGASGGASETKAMVAETTEANVGPSAASPAPAPSAGIPNPKDATKDEPFVNTLGMPFVPIKGTKVLFCIWETRVKDFETFVKDSGYSEREKPPFEQAPDHPVVMVSWNDAKAFCDWLSKKDGHEYRLPTDEEWDAAAGKEEFPWGKEWPPPKGTDNFAGEESKLGDSGDPQDQNMIKGWRDDHPRMAAVGSYKPLKNGLYNLCGNVREWCEDWYTEAIYKKQKAGGGGDPKGGHMVDIAKGNTRKVVRGGSWRHSNRNHLSCSLRNPDPPDGRNHNYGFRCVVVGSVSAP